MPVCLNHPEVKATVRCHACGKPLCPDCGMRDGRALYCSAECHARQGSAKGLTASIFRGRASLYRRKLLAAAGATLLLGILLLLWGWLAG